MNWFDRVKGAGGGIFNDVVDTGTQYVQGQWENKKEVILREDPDKEVKAAVPNSQPSYEAGKGLASKGLRRPVNWQKAGVVIAGIALIKSML